MILLTGATGFLGQDLVKKLKNVRCLVRKPSLKNSVLGDITDKSSLQKILKGIDVVIHAAAVIKGNEKSYREVNVEGTRNLIEAAKKARVKHFIFISSFLAAYKNLTPYGKSKLLAEEIVKNSGIPYTILRLSIIYKPTDNKTIGRLIKLIKRLPVIPLIDSGNYVVQPVYIGDAVAAIVTASTKKPKNKTYYLVGPVITYKNFIKAITLSLHLKRLLLPVPSLLLKPLLTFYNLFSNKYFTVNQIKLLTANQIFSYEAARKDLDFSPLSFSEGLKKR